MDKFPSETFIQHYVQNSINTVDQVTDVLFHCKDGFVPSYQIALAPISPFLKSEFHQNSYDKVIAILLPEFVCSEIKEYLLDLFNYNNRRHAELNELLNCAILCNPINIDENDIEEYNDENDDNESKDVINGEYSIPESPLKERDEEMKTINITNTSKKNSINPGRKYRSMVWDHFDKIEKDTSICRYCKSFISCSTGQTKGMRNHLATIHPEKVGLEVAKKVFPKRGQPKVPSIVWNHFDKIDKDRSVCRYCKRNISCSTGQTKSMRNHLAYIHPEVVGQDFVNKVLPYRAQPKVRC